MNAADDIIIEKQDKQTGAAMKNDNKDRLGEVFTYKGKPLAASSKTICTKIGRIKGGQDGAIYDGLLFRFDANGTGQAYSMESFIQTAEIRLEKNDIISMHSNAVCFGNTFYDPGDRFPLLYSNVYNNYSSENDRREGTCGVYRIVEDGSGFVGELVQVIKVGFTDDLCWKSAPEIKDVRPYGNFIVDTMNNKLYAFTMRDADHKTRYFSFELPELSEGVMNDSYGCRLLTLEKEDIKDKFDCDYSYYLQGACYHENRIYSLEGFDNYTAARPRMQVVDLFEKKTIAVMDFMSRGLVSEPEFVCFYNGLLYYSDAAGQLFTFEFI